MNNHNDGMVAGGHWLTQHSAFPLAISRHTVSHWVTQRHLIHRSRDHCAKTSATPRRHGELPKRVHTSEGGRYGGKSVHHLFQAKL